MGSLGQARTERLQSPQKISPAGLSLVPTRAAISNPRLGGDTIHVELAAIILILRAEKWPKYTHLRTWNVAMQNEEY
jgi:hypothetical protein